MSVGAQMVVVLEAVVEHCVSLVLGHTFEFSRLNVTQADVFHYSALPVGSQQRRCQIFSITVSSNEAQRILI
jgi:hypothetical protein